MNKEVNEEIERLDKRISDLRDRRDEQLSLFLVDCPLCKRKTLAYEDKKFLCFDGWEKIYKSHIHCVICGTELEFKKQEIWVIKDEEKKV